MSNDSEYRAKMEHVMANLAATEPDDVTAPTFIDHELQNGKMAWAISYKTSAGGRGPSEK